MQQKHARSAAAEGERSDSGSRGVVKKSPNLIDSGTVIKDLYGYDQGSGAKDHLLARRLFASSAEISFMVLPQHLIPQFSQVQSIRTLTIAPHFSQRTIFSILSPPID
jgi:hypothetical protein